MNPGRNLTISTANIFFGGVELRRAMKLNNGQREPDHILVPSSWQKPDVVTYQTSSDHLALVLTVGL